MYMRFADALGDLFKCEMSLSANFNRFFSFFNEKIVIMKLITPSGL